MKVLITGGSGFLGINLIRCFLNKGINDIRALDIEDFDYSRRNRIEAVKGDIRNKRDVAKAMKDVEIIINAAAALPLYKKKDIYSTDVEGTTNLLDRKSVV